MSSSDPWAFIKRFIRFLMFMTGRDFSHLPWKELN